MEMQKLYLLVPLAPLIGAMIAGLFCRVIPRWVAHTATIAGVAIAFIASVIIFKDVQAGNTYNGTVYTWLTSGDYKFEVGFPDRHPDHDHDAGRYLRLADGAYLHHRLHAGRSGLQPFLQLHLVVYLLDVDAGDEQQLHAAVLRLGSGRSGFLFADRFLVHPSDGDISPT
jgi:hypothetical protein